MSGKTVLIADDDSAIRTVLSQALSRAGYAVRSTATAGALWRWVSEGQGDAVVTDVVLPDENAFDVIPRIKKLRPTLPIIVMSAKNTIMTAMLVCFMSSEIWPEARDCTAPTSFRTRFINSPAG